MDQQSPLSSGMLTCSQSRAGLPATSASFASSTPFPTAPIATSTTASISTATATPTQPSAAATRASGQISQASALLSQPQQPEVVLQTTDGQRVPLRAFIQSVVQQGASTLAGRRGYLDVLSVAPKVGALAVRQGGLTASTLAFRLSGKRLLARQGRRRG